MLDTLEKLAEELREEIAQVREAGNGRSWDWDREQRLRDVLLWLEERAERAQPTPVSTGEAIMPKVNGRSFRCSCGANVFTKYICTEHGEEYKCNGCGNVYGE